MLWLSNKLSFSDISKESEQGQQTLSKEPLTSSSLFPLLTEESKILSCYPSSSCHATLSEWVHIGKLQKGLRKVHQLKISEQLLHQIAKKKKKSSWAILGSSEGAPALGLLMPWGQCRGPDSPPRWLGFSKGGMWLRDYVSYQGRRESLAGEGEKNFDGRVAERVGEGISDQGELAWELGSLLTLWMGERRAARLPPGYSDLVWCDPHPTLWMPPEISSIW